MPSSSVPSTSQSTYAIILSEVPTKSLYFTNRWIDVAAIGGLSIVTFAALSVFDISGVRGSLMSAAFYGMWICNWPHFSATSYRLLQLA